MPDGKKKTDEFFGDVEVYYDFLSATVPVARLAGVNTPIEITVSYQGCADAGLCYPPVTKTVAVQLPAAGTPAPGVDPPGGATRWCRNRTALRSLITGGSLFAVILKFFGLGLRARVHALRPADDPDPVRNHRRARRGGDAAAVVPALGGLRARHGPDLCDRRRRLRGRRPAGAGVLPATLDHHYLRGAVRRFLRSRCSGSTTSSCPSALETRLAGASGRQRSGTFAGTAIMGVLSALVVSACVAPPMVAALAVIGQTGRDPARGDRALRHGDRHGLPATRRGRWRRPFPAPCGSLDDDDQGAVRRAVPRRRRMDALARPAGRA